MALIICPECGKQISDKAQRCIHCGFELTSNPINTTDNSLKYVDDNENNRYLDETTMNKTDSTLYETQTSVANKLDLRKGIIIGALAFVIIVIAVVVGSSIHQKTVERKKADKEKQLETEYMENYTSAANEMFNGGLKAEKACGLIHDVWSNCIFDESDVTTDKYTSGTDDFNVALANLFTDSSFVSDVADIKDSKVKVDDLMKELKNPPDKYDDAYDALQDLYTEYTTMVSLAEEPSGSLTSYTSEFNSADTDFVTAYNKVQIYLE